MWRRFMTEDEFDSWLGYCRLGEPDYPMCTEEEIELRQMETDDSDIIWKEDEGNTGRGRAFSLLAYQNII